MLTATPDTSAMEIVLKDIYCLYTDCVLKDPFYELEMPIKSELFVHAVDKLIQKVEKANEYRRY